MLATHATVLTVLGLSSIDWTVIAAIAQGLAALGAIALLTVTWMSQRDAQEAIANSGILAEQTGALARATQAQLAASTLPVIQVTSEPRERRLRLTNKGNGPLLSPAVKLGNEALAVVSSDPNSSSFAETAAFAVSEDAYALLALDVAPTGTVEVSGWTVAGAEFRAEVDVTEFGDRSALVARPVP